MEDIAQLQAEIRRLRDLLEENGIDPEPYIEPPPQFGPPTEWEWRMTKMFQKSAAQAATMLLTQKADWLFSSGDRWPSTLRVRLPVDFTAQH